MSERKILEAVASGAWAEGGLCRVCLIREDENGEPEDLDSAEPMKAELDSLYPIETRLYQAAVCAHPKDFGSGDAQDSEIRFAKEAAAKRCAKAVNAELKRIEKGEPGPSNVALQFAAMMMRKPKR